MAASMESSEIQALITASTAALVALCAAARLSRCTRVKCLCIDIHRNVNDASGQETQNNPEIKDNSG
jgi:hypothetical protein